MSQPTITFIGGGNMAASLISGLIADQYPAKSILVSDPNSETLSHLAAHHGIVPAKSNKQGAEAASIIVLAVKPQAVKAVAKDIAQHLNHQPLIISIAAGVREHDLNRWLGGNTALVRTMPNTPAMVQTGATALHASANVSQVQQELAENIMRAVGLTCWVKDEATIDAVTALSGSGPAYFFLVMEAMQAAGEAMGIEPKTAKLLTLQTALGAAKMAIESQDTPAMLRQKVTSPGGTTEQAIKTLTEDGDLIGLFERALKDAQNRSIELSKLMGE